MNDEANDDRTPETDSLQRPSAKPSRLLAQTSEMGTRHMGRKAVQAVLIAIVATLLAFCATSIGCSARDDDASSSTANKLVTDPGTELWGPDSGTISIPYCFVTQVPTAGCSIQGGSPAVTISGNELAEYVRAFENSWPRASRIRMNYAGMCNLSSDASQKVVIWVIPGTSSWNPNGQAGYGTSNLKTVNTITCPEQASMRIWSNGTTSTRSGYVAIHELGHVLGFWHEQDQDAGYSDPNYGTGDCKTGVGNDAGEGPPVHWPGTLLTPYDPDSVMNYCHTDREDDGRMSDYDIVGLQTAYGAVDQTKDSDGDGYVDYQDNCPYVVNGAQIDTNFETELQAQKNAGYTTDDGRRPLATDSQAYKDRWHVAYAGDACDAIVSSRAAATGDWVSSHTRTASQCWSIVTGGTNSRTLGPASGGSFPIRYNSNMQFNGTVGGPVGFASDNRPSTTSENALCRCTSAMDSDPLVRATCANPSTSNCIVADDTQFPAQNGSLAPGAYKAIHSEYQLMSHWSEQYFASVPVNHVDPMLGYTPQPTTAVWAVVPDLPSFGDAGGYIGDADIVGVFWTRVQVFGYGIKNLHPGVPVPVNDAGQTYVPNIQSTYIGADGAWDYGVCSLTYVTPFSYRWIRVPYCDPTPYPSAYGLIQHMVATPSAILGTNQDGTVTDITPRFTAAAQTALGNLSSGTWDVLVADDRINGQARDEVGPNGLFLDTGTTRIRGALTQGLRIDVQQPATPVGTQTTASLRSYAASANMLYSLEFVPASGIWQLGARNVSAALAGTSSVVNTNLGSSFVSPKAIAFSRTTKVIYVLDFTVSGRGHFVQLDSVDPSTGTVTALWRSALTVTTPTAFFLSTTTDGDIILGMSGKGDGLYHVLQMDSTGRPWHSASATGSLYAAPVGYSGGLTLPLTQTVTSSQPNAQFTQLSWSSMSAGACGSSWMQATFGRTGTGVTGTLPAGMVCP